MNAFLFHPTTILVIAYLANAQAWFSYFIEGPLAGTGSAFFVSAMCLLSSLLTWRSPGLLSEDSARRAQTYRSASSRRLTLVLRLVLVTLNVLLLLRLIGMGWSVEMNFNNLIQHIGSIGIALLVACGLVLSVIWGNWLAARLNGKTGQP